MSGVVCTTVPNWLNFEQVVFTVLTFDTAEMNSHKCRDILL